MKKTNKVTVLLVLALSVLAMVGCVPEATRDMTPEEEELVMDTIDRWDAWTVDHPEFAPVTDRCYEAMMTIGVYVAEPEEIPGLWGQARAGYVERYYLIIMSREADWCATFPHEVLHLLADCMGYGPDSGHTRDYWLSQDEGGLELPDVRAQGPETEGWTGCP